MKYKPLHDWSVNRKEFNEVCVVYENIVHKNCKVNVE